MGLRAAASIIKERLRLSSKDLMTALGSGQRNGARPNHTIFLSEFQTFSNIIQYIGVFDLVISIYCSLELT